MEKLLTEYHVAGLALGICTFLIIGLFHPVVVKAEYYWGTRCWWVFLLLGLGGVIICLMWFATNHVWTADNWNLVWMNPLFLIPVCMPNCWAKNLIIDLLAAVSALGLICSWLLPQPFHPAAAVIILLTVLMALSRRAIYRKY